VAVILLLAIPAALAGSALAQGSAREASAVAAGSLPTSPEALTPPQQPAFSLTADERHYLASLPVLRASVPGDWEPFSYPDENGRFAGILSDYLAYLSQVLGIRLTYEFQQSPTQSALAREAGQVDLNVYVLPDKGTHVRAPTRTLPFERNPQAIVGKRGAAAISDVSELAGQRIALVQESMVAEQLHAEVTGVTTIDAPSITAGLALVADGKADYFVGNLAAADRAIQNDFVGQLKVVGATGFRQLIGIDVRGGLEPLVPLIDRAIASMPPALKLAIRNRHLTTTYQFGLSKQELIRQAAPYAVGVSLAVAALLVAYLRLRREVSARERAERDLRAQLLFRSKLIDMMPFPVARLDSKWRYTDVNPPLCRLLGVQAENLIGKSGDFLYSRSVFRPETVDRMEAIFGRDAKVEEEYLELLGQDGEVRHALLWSYPLSDPGSDLEGRLAVFVDITAVVKAERKIRETEARLESVTRNLSAAVFQMRRDPAGRMSYEYVGGSLSTLPAIEWDDLRQPQGHSGPPLQLRELPRLVSAIEASARAVQPLKLDVRVGADTEERWLQINATPRDDGYQGVLWSGYWSDTSAEHQHAAELEAARQAAEAASVAKDRFVAVMSHEIRTPMSGVLGLVELLAHSPLKSDQADMVRMIHQSAGALLQILDDVLDYSKLQASRLRIDAVPFDVRELCDLVLGLMSARAHEKGVALRCSVAPGVAAELVGDGHRLRQVLFNLLGNAIKFTAKGEVALNVSVQANLSDRQVIVFNVTDTGVGVAEDVIPLLFKPFVQADASTARRFGGTGLGLAICAGLTRLMGGTLEMRSKPAAGTQVTVVLTLPVARRRYEDQHLRGARAVIAVQSPSLAQGIAGALAALDIDLVTGSESLEPEAGTAPQHADLAFVDAARAIPGEWPGVPCIAVSDLPEPTGYRAGNDGLVLSANPLTWRGIRAVASLALTGEAHDSARSVTASGQGRAPNREAALAGGTLILVADDNPVNRHLLQRQLTLLGCASDAVANGAMALASYGANRYALLLTDCHMPVVTGYALATGIRDLENAGGTPTRLPIVGITASVEAEETQRCIDAGMDDCLRKPASLDTLRRCVEKWAPRCLQANGDEASRGEHGEQGEPIAPAGQASPPPAQPVSALAPPDWNRIGAAFGYAGRDNELAGILAAALADDARDLREILRVPEIDAFREWAHRVSGAISVIPYPSLLAAVEAFHAIVRRQDIPQITQAGQLMIDTLEHAAELFAGGVEGGRREAVEGAEG